MEDQTNETTTEESQYNSRGDFFETARVVRGYSEIAHIWDALSTVTECRSFICGGYVRFMCSPRLRPEPAGDVDIYSQSKDDADALVLHLKAQGMSVKHENDISITFDRPDKNHRWHTNPIIQVVKPINEGAIVATGDIGTILKNFDFTVIRAGLLSPSHALVDCDYKHDEGSRLLRIKNIHCPVSSLLRCMKYARKGYFLRPAEAMKLFADWQGRDDNYRLKIIELFQSSALGNISQEEIDELERLMRID